MSVSGLSVTVRSKGVTLSYPTSSSSEFTLRSFSVTCQAGFGRLMNFKEEREKKRLKRELKC